MGWHISESEEGNYYGDFATREEAVAEGIAEGGGGFYVGQARAPKPLSNGVFAESIIESALETLEDDWGFEFVSFEPTPDQIADLQTRMRSLVDQWVKSNGLTPDWFVIDNAEYVEVSDGPS